jgi:alcohol dehydrogenase class IV
VKHTKCITKERRGCFEGTWYTHTYHLAGMAFTSGGLGTTRGLTYTLGTRYHITDGRSHAIMLSHVMKYNVRAGPSRYRDIAGLMGQKMEGDTLSLGGSKAIRAVNDLLAPEDVPRDFRAMG